MSAEIAEMVKFLHVRLEDTENEAKSAQDVRSDYHAWHQTLDLTAAGMDDREALLITTWSPARILAEVDAKRRTIIRCEEEMLSGIPRLVHFCEQTIKDMVRAYADHPDFKDKWRAA
jgi:hypothetical protein